MDKVYDCYTYAKELGFTEAEARDIAASKTGRGQDATVLRRMARAKGLIAEPKTEGKGKTSATKTTLSTEPKKHRHSYRKDGTCACGHVRRERKVKA